MTDVSADDLFKDLIWQPIVKLILAELFKLLPFLAWGPLGPIVTLIVTYLAEKIFTAVKLFVDLQVISLKNKEHQAAYDRASVSLKIIAKDKGIDSPEFRKARDENKAALSDFVKFAT